MSFRDILIEEDRRLDEIIAKAMEDLNKAPEGSLIACTANGKVHFYRRIQKKNSYLSKIKDRDMISALTQKAYAKKVIKLAIRQKAILGRFITDYDSESIFKILIDGRHDGLFTPYLIKPLEGEPFSFSHAQSLDLELVSKLKDICSKILNN